MREGEKERREGRRREGEKRRREGDKSKPTERPTMAAKLPAYAIVLDNG